MKMKFFCAAMLALPALMMAQKPKSQKEAEAVNAIIQAKTPDEKMAAVDNLIMKFADSEFKIWALNYAATSAQQKKDSAKAIFYADQAVSSDKNDAEAMVLIAAELATHTREFDLDKDDKLAKSEKSANAALAMRCPSSSGGYCDLRPVRRRVMTVDTRPKFD